jgi:hypothetical protein
MSNAKIVDSKLLLSRDFSTLMEWSINKIPKITPDWTDFSITAPEMIYLSTACYIYDIMHYSVDRKYLNNQIRYTRDYKSLMNMCILRGVDIPGYNASKTLMDVIFNTTGLPINDKVSLPKGYKFEVYDAVTQKSIILNLDIATDLTSGTTRLTLTEGITKAISLLLSSISPIGTYILEDEKIALNTLEFYVDGTLWEKVNDAFLVTNSISSYSTTQNSYGHTVLKLMPGFYAKIASKPILIKYNITTGSLGNVGIGSEITPQTRLVDTYGTNVTNKITFSIVRSSEGSDAYDIEETRSLLGSSSSDVQTLVNLEDYEDVINTVDAVVGCVVKDVGVYKTIHFIPDINYESYGYTLEEIAQNIMDAVIDRVPAYTKVVIYPVLIRPLSLNISVYLNRNELNTIALKSKIEDFIYNMFDRENMTAGLELNRAIISSSIEVISTSISHVVIPYPIADIQCSWNEIMRLDTLTITFDRR